MADLSALLASEALHLADLAAPGLTPLLVHVLSGYRDLILRDAPVGYWPLDEPANALIAIDRAPVPHAGAYTGAIALAQPGPLADGTTALDCQGSTGQAVISGYTLTLIPAVTMEAWIWADTVDAGQLRVFFAGRNTTYLGLNSGVFPTSIRFSLDTNGGVQNILNTTSVFNAATWYHVAATLDPTDNKMRFYVNGVLNATSAAITPGTGARISTGTFRLGAYDNLNPLNFWDGKLAHAAIYSSCLTPAQILAHYQARLLTSPGSDLLRVADTVSAARILPWAGAADRKLAIPSYPRRLTLGSFDLSPALTRRMQVVPIARRMIATDMSSAPPYPEKLQAPGDSLDWSFDWTAFMASGETIQASAWTVAQIGGPRSDPPLLGSSGAGTVDASNLIASIIVSNGRLGTAWLVTNNITTSAARKASRSFELLFVQT